MHIDHHPLIKDFPELRVGDTDFARLADAYETLDKRICRIEAGSELLADDALLALKQERVSIKDDLARRLKRAAGQCCGCGNGCKS